MSLLEHTRQGEFREHSFGKLKYMLLVVIVVLMVTIFCSALIGSLYINREMRIIREKLDKIKITGYENETEIETQSKETSLNVSLEIFIFIR